jgi:hypothetical protein
MGHSLKSIFYLFLGSIHKYNRRFQTVLADSGSGIVFSNVPHTNPTYEKIITLFYYPGAVYQLRLRLQRKPCEDPVR